MFLRFFPAILSFLVLGAHFLRGGNLALVAAALAVPFLLLVRKLWALRAVQLALVVAAAVWVRAGIEIGRVRAAHGGPWLRMALILGAVAILALLAAALLQAKRVRKVYDSRS